MPGAGNYTINATYQKPNRQIDAYGDKKNAGFVDAFDVFISVKPLRAKEMILAKSAQMNVSHTVRCYYHPEILSEGRFYYVDYASKKRYLDIVGIINADEKFLELEITCNETVKDEQ